MVSVSKRALRQAASGPRRKIAFGFITLTVAVACVVTRASQPRYKPVLVGLSPTEEAGIRSALGSGGGFAPRVAPGGTIELPADQIPEARLRLATSGKLPKGPGGSRRIAGERALVDAFEKNAARKIESVRGVESALVHVTPPRNVPSLPEAARGAVGVLIVVKEGGASEKAVTDLVRAAVPGIARAGVLAVDRRTMGEMRSAYAELRAARTDDPFRLEGASYGAALLR